MTLRLKNDMSADWDRKVDTKAGLAEALFRTEGPAMLLVTSPGELRNYQLVIWVGPDIKIHKMVKPPFVTQAAYEKKHGKGRKAGGGGSGTTIAIVVMIALVALFAFIASRQLKKKRKA